MKNNFTALREFLIHLESIGELKRIKVEVDPVLETTEIAIRAMAEKKPALLFENPKNAKYPLAMNILASEKRIEYALGFHPEELGEKLINFFDQIFPVKLSKLASNTFILKRFFSSIPKIKNGVAQQIVESPKLTELPIQKCWPEDGGRFITLGQVFTYDPITNKRNVGVYRIQVFDEATTGMHWQIQKGGGFHFYQAQKLNRPLELAVVLGTDPALLLASVAALPEGIDEVMFAGFLRSKRVEMTRAKSISINVPANAEFVLEGKVIPGESRLEGPFGDHFGHYSAAANFPVFHISTITHRKNPIYPGTIVGKPPMEDKYLGDATQQILGPLIRLMHPEIKSMWAYYEAGFHNLLVLSIEERYQKEAVKTALSVIGEGQLSLTKCVITISHDVNPKDWNAVLGEIKNNFDPHYDFIIIPKVPLDTLDFTSYKMNLGSKMILDACKKSERNSIPSTINNSSSNEQLKQTIYQLDNRIMDMNIVNECLLIVKINSNIFDPGNQDSNDNAGREILRKLLQNNNLSSLKLIAVTSEDVDIHNRESYIWGIFTRFDCERDVLFKEQKLVGITPVYFGPMGIDATWKRGYPSPLMMDERIKKLVDEKWETYWK